MRHRAIGEVRYEHVRAEPPELATSILDVAKAHGVATGAKYSETALRDIVRALAAEPSRQP